MKPLVNVLLPIAVLSVGNGLLLNDHNIWAGIVQGIALFWCRWDNWQ